MCNVVTHQPCAAQRRGKLHNVRTDELSWQSTEPGIMPRGWGLLYASLPEGYWNVDRKLLVSREA